MKRRIEPYSDAWFYWIFAGTAIGFALFRRTKRTHSTARTSKFRGICGRQTKRKDRHDEIL